MFWVKMSDTIQTFINNNFIIIFHISTTSIQSTHKPFTDKHKHKHTQMPNSISKSTGNIPLTVEDHHTISTPSCITNGTLSPNFPD